GGRGRKKNRFPAAAACRNADCRGGDSYERLIAGRTIVDRRVRAGGGILRTTRTTWLRGELPRAERQRSLRHRALARRHVAPQHVHFMRALRSSWVQACRALPRGRGPRSLFPN